MKYTTNVFIEKANIVHNNLYNYSKVIYTGSKNKVEIQCFIHGYFQQTASEHLRGRGCVLCGHNKNKKDEILNFIKKANFIHNNKYDYSSIIYKKSNIKVDILCNYHLLIFKQRPNDHLSGHGCPLCVLLTTKLKLKNNLDVNNYKKSSWIKKSKNREGILYIIKCYNENEEFYKFGITYTSVHIRYNAKKKMPYNYKIIKEIKSYDLNYIWDLEKRFKKKVSYKYYEPIIAFYGSKQECFK